MTNERQFFVPDIANLNNRLCPYSPVFKTKSIRFLLKSLISLFQYIYIISGSTLRTQDSKVMYWVLKQLCKYGFCSTLKKCQFYKIKVRFLYFVILAQEIKIEERRIEAIKSWLGPKSVRVIQVFLNFANFYKTFIRNFNSIAMPLT